MASPDCRYDPRSCQSLLGYGRAAHARSGGICHYCGFGKERVEFYAWRQLSIDHVVPARLFPGKGKTLQSVFPNLPELELRKLADEINKINLVTACNFCNSMTSRMNDISAEGILSPEGYSNVTSVDAEPVQVMLRRLRERVDQVLPMKRHRVEQCLRELRKTFDAEVKPELQNARNRPVKRGVLAAIDQLKGQLLNCRAYFPHVDENLIAQQEFESPRFYEVFGYKLHFAFSQPLTRDDIGRLNAIGNFVNQSYLVFLCSVLEFHHVLVYMEPVNDNMNGHEHVKLLRDIRNVIAHRAGQYDVHNSEHNRLFSKLHELYQLEPKMDPQQAETFPLPIDQVLLPMTEHCREYAEALLESVNACAL